MLAPRCLALPLLLAALCTLAAAPPPTLHLDKWIEQLGADDDAVVRRASANLWKAGPAAMPTLKRALKSPDPDVILRAQVILARLEWGIHPDTPAAVVTEIERYRDGDPGQKVAAIERLLREGRAGCAALRHLLPRAGDEESRKQISQKFKQILRPAVRERIVSGDLDSAEMLLDAVAVSGDTDAIMDLGTLHVQRGTAAGVGRQLTQLAAKGDRAAAVRGTYLYRAAGDLQTARRLAELTGDKELLANVLGEMEEYADLLKVEGVAVLNDPAVEAVLRYKTGDRDGADAALKRIPEKEIVSRATVQFWIGRPREGIDLLIKANNLASACSMLALQGRRREALALKAPADKAESAGWLLLEQAVVAQQMGEAEEARKRIDAALPIVEKFAPTSDGLPCALLKAGRRMGRRAEMLSELGKILDRVKIAYLPYSTLSELSSKDSEALYMCWQFLRARDANMPPSVVLRRLDEWFVQGKPGEHFEATLTAARRHAFPIDQQPKWPMVIARVCVRVGLPMQAEEILKDVARQTDTSAAPVALGEFLFEQKRWQEAADTFDLALKREPAAYLPLYLRGVSLVRAGKAREGQVLIDRARLLPLADEDMRYELAEAMSKRGLSDEALAEQLLLTRTALFRSVLITNVCSELGEREEKRGRYLDAARYYRRLGDNMALRGGGAFIDDRSHLWIPAWAYHAQTQGLIRAGKLDEALREARRGLDYLPEDTEPAIDLIRAFDAAKRKADANKLFAELFEQRKAACVAEPRSGGSHNRLAWLAARTGRKLDWGLRHALAATQAQPDYAGAYDTLAEVQFQRGRRDAALAAIRRAMQLAPDQSYFAAQQRRIEKGDRGAELPPQPR